MERIMIIFDKVKATVVKELDSYCDICDQHLSSQRRFLKMSARLYFRFFTALILAGLMIMAQAFAQGYSNPIQQSDQLLQQGDQQLGNNDFQGALASFQSALSMYSQIVNTAIANNDTVPIKLQVRISRAVAATAIAYQGRGDSTKAGDYAQKALILGKQLNDQFTIQNATQVLANINRGNQPNVISRPQLQANTCENRCYQQYPSEPNGEYQIGTMGAWQDCLDACDGKINRAQSPSERPSGRVDQACVARAQQMIEDAVARGGAGTAGISMMNSCYR
jgi:tetratricopeptide (TPR) repeat protein